MLLSDVARDRSPGGGDADDHVFAPLLPMSPVGDTPFHRHPVQMFPIRYGSHGFAVGDVRDGNRTGDSPSFIDVTGDICRVQPLVQRLEL